MAPPRKSDVSLGTWHVLFVQSTQPAFVLDPATARILAANRAAVDFFGVAEAELVGTPWPGWAERQAGEPASAPDAEPPVPGAVTFDVMHRPQGRPPVRGRASWMAVEWATGPAVLSLHKVPVRPVTPPPVTPSPNRMVAADVRALGETAVRLNTFSTVEECGLEVLRRVGHILGRGDVRLLLTDSSGQLASSLSYTVGDSSATEPPLRLALAESIAQRVTDSQSPGARPWFVMAPEDLPPPWRRLAPMVVLPVATTGALVGLIVVSMSPIPTGNEEYARCDAAAAVAAMLASVLRRVRLQSELRRQQEKNHGLLRTIDAVSWLLDLETLAPRYLSPQVERVMGRHAHEFYEDPPLWMEVVHPDDRREVEAWYGDVARGRHQPLDYRVRRPDGTTAWVSARARMADLEDGGRTSLDGLLTDITASHNADEALRREARRNASLVAAFGQVVYEHVIATGEMKWEGPIERLIGGPRDVLGDDIGGWLRRLHPDDRDKALEEFNWAFDHGRPYDVTYRLMRSDGSYAWLHDRGIPHSDDHDRRESRIGVLHDVSQQRAADERQQLMEQRLQHSQRLESIGLMASGVAHDFNNLLAGILGHLGLTLMEIGEDSALRPSLELAEAGAMRASELTRQLLQLAGRGEIRRSKVMLPRLISELAELLRSTIPAKTSLVFTLPADLPPVVGDASQLRQVFLNLITNAAQSIVSAKGEIHIDGSVVELRALAQPAGMIGQTQLDGAYVAVCVRDNGSGIPQAIRERIFDPFFSTRSEGHGLGLAAVLGILRAHGGAIRVESELDAGTAMTIYLPVLTQEQLTALRESTPHAPLLNASHALVFDSDPAFRDFLVELLRRIGLIGHGVESWVTAQPILEQWPIGIVLLEEQAARRQVPLAAQEIQSVMARIPTILLKDGTLSGNPLDDTLNSLAVASVVKPVSARAMVEAIKEVLAKAGADPSPQPSRQFYSDTDTAENKPT